MNQRSPASVLDADLPSVVSTFFRTFDLVGGPHLVISKHSPVAVPSVVDVPIQVNPGSPLGGRDVPEPCRDQHQS